MFVLHFIVYFRVFWMFVYLDVFKCYFSWSLFCVIFFVFVIYSMMFFRFRLLFLAFRSWLLVNHCPGTLSTNGLGNLATKMVPQVVRKMFSVFWRRIYRNVSHWSLVRFWDFWTIPRHVFDVSHKMFERSFLRKCSRWSLSSNLFFIAHTWGRFWPILVLATFMCLLIRLYLLVCICGAFGPSLLSANAGIVILTLA